MPRTFLITGAGRGIGRGLSRLLLQQGHRVFLVDFNKEELEHTTTRLATQHKRGVDFDSMHCNLRSSTDIDRAAIAVRDLFSGHLDCLINNAASTAGVGGPHLTDPEFPEVWAASLETNLTGAMLMSRACIPYLRRRSDREVGGCIIHMASTRAFMSEVNNEPYAATKAGLIGLSQSMSTSLAEEGVRCSAILPGWINVSNECKKADEDGQTWEDGLSKDDHAWHSTGRVGKVEDILRAVQYLEAAEFVTGEQLVVDGGVTKKMVYPE